MRSGHHGRRLAAAAALNGAMPVAAVPAVAQHRRDTAAPAAPGDGNNIVVQATRTGRRAWDEPLHVEVLDREEIEEKSS